MRFVRRNMKVAAGKTPACVEIPQSSLHAVFYAVVNAVAQSDWSVSERRIRLSMFSDRLEIVSPGDLPNGMTIETMPDAGSTRNEKP